MDCLSLHGGSPANFCDIGGGATTEAVKKAFELLIQDPNVKSIFVNVSFPFIVIVSSHHSPRHNRRVDLWWHVRLGRLPLVPNTN